MKTFESKRQEEAMIHSADGRRRGERESVFLRVSSVYCPFGRVVGVRSLLKCWQFDHGLPRAKTSEMSRAGRGIEIRKMKLRKSYRCEGATTERQTHTFGHLAAKNTPSTVFVLWDSCHQQGRRGCRASARLTRGDIRVARPHVEGPRACVRQGGAAL